VGRVSGGTAVRIVYGSRREPTRGCPEGAVRGSRTEREPALPGLQQTGLATSRQGPAPSLRCRCRSESRQRGALRAARARSAAWCATSPRSGPRLRPARGPTALSPRARSLDVARCARRTASGAAAA